MAKNKRKSKETIRNSLIVRWVSIVSLTIMVSFIVFSVIVYSLVEQQTLSQEQTTSDRVVRTLDNQLDSVPNELQIANVIPALSPSTRRLLKGGPTIKKQGHSAFNDDLISSISNPDISVVVYNRHQEVTFSNGDKTPAYHAFKGLDQTKTQHSHGRTVLLTYHKVYSNRNGRLTGYIVVANQMSHFNGLMHHLLSWMILISVISIVIFVLITYFVVRDVVKPIKAMSNVARQVNDDPNSSVRIKELHRQDELEDLALSFNKMLDRMQGYIEQQKQFVSDVSHELRTPVAVIEGHLHMLERWGKDDPQILNESISASLQEADRMKHLIQEMLDLTRAEQIDLQFPDEVSKVAEVVRRVTSDLAMIHQDFKIQVDLDDLPPGAQIRIYHGHLEQLLIILIDNAVKYSTKRKQINVSAGLVDQNKVKIVVQDFGEGIAKKDQKKIFNRFYRVDKARTRATGGNGLGLAIAQKLVNAYHGHLSVDSVLGQGSQFFMVFPLLSPAQAAHLQELAQKERKREKPAGIL